MILKRYKTNQKLIAGFLVVLILMPVALFSVAKKVAAQESVSACLAAAATGTVAAGAGTVAATGLGAAVPTYSKIEAKIASITAGSTTSIENYKKKECLKEILRDILKITAKRLLAKMTESTVNWINSGFHGAPLFVENPGSFFKDIAKSEIRSLVNSIGHDSVRQPFGKSTAIGIINSFKSTFEQNSQYSLSKVTDDPALLESFRNDFSVGGWDGFLLQTQFPQNNYIGYNLMVGDELARRTAGTTSSQAEKVRDTLQQGLGFLSPQVCPSNPNYDNTKNAWSRPTFKTQIKPRFNDCSSKFNQCYKKNPDYVQCLDQQSACELEFKKYTDSINKEKADWDKTNSCPGGLVTTTPGSVVGASIMKAITGPYDQTSLAAAMGNSMSAIFDALLNKFMSSGLNALSNKISGGGGSSNNDDFNYYGNTLGTSPTSTNNTGFNWGEPDEVIVLSTFKLEVQNAIDNGNKELRLIDGTAGIQAGANEYSKFANTTGILQVFDDIWPKTAELDMCLPGPNIKWQSRIDENVGDPAEGTSTSAVNAFKTWVASKINVELPSSRTYLGAVDSIQTTNNQAGEVWLRQGSITETLIKLNSIKAELSTMSTEPSSGSAGEATLIRLKERYNGMLVELSTPTTVSEAQNKLADAKDKLTNLNALLARCGTERTTKGWTNPGGENSTGSAGTEKNAFCSSYGNPPVSCEVLFRTEIADYKSN